MSADCYVLRSENGAMLALGAGPVLTHDPALAYSWPTAQDAQALAAQYSATLGTDLSVHRTGPLQAPVAITVQLDADAAWQLAQFAKRVGFSDFRSNAQDDAEAYAMRDAMDKVALALREAGFAPR